MGRREVLNSRNFSMIFLSFQRGTAPNSVSVLMNGHLRHFGLSVGRSCLPHPLFHFHKDHEKLIAHSKPSLRAHHSPLETDLRNTKAATGYSRFQERLL